MGTINECPRCHGRWIRTNPHRGTSVCRKCGLQLESKYFVVTRIFDPLHPPKGVMKVVKHNGGLQQEMVALNQPPALSVSDVPVTKKEEDVSA